MATTKKKANDLPYNESAEMACIGSALLSKDCLFNVLSFLRAEDFFLSKHQIIYRVLEDLAKKGIAVDVLTVTEALMNLKEYENVGGVEYLQECADSMVATSSLSFYINIVSDQAVLRNLLITMRDLDNRYQTEEIQDVNLFVEESEGLVKEACSKRRISSFKKASEVATSIQLSLDTPREIGEDNVTGLTTGYPQLNKVLAGFQPGNMIILAARPSVGKTALALNMGFRAASRTNKPVAIFSLEMSAELLIKRLIGTESNVPLDKIASGQLTPNERNAVAEAIRSVSSAPLFIDDSPEVRLTDIIAKSRKLQASNPDLGLIIVDYLGLIASSNTARSSDSRQEEVRKTSAALKALGRELNVPVIVVCQLSRDVEKRDNKRPMLSDLRESGSIEQDADVVILLYRADYYDRAKKASEKKGGEMSKNDKIEMARARMEEQLSASQSGNVSYVEVNIAKNRNGKTDTTGLFFYKSFGRFDSPSEEWEEQMRRLNESED